MRIGPAVASGLSERESGRFFRFFRAPSLFDVYLASERQNTLENYFRRKAKNTAGFDPSMQIFASTRMNLPAHENKTIEFCVGHCDLRSHCKHDKERLMNQQEVLRDLECAHRNIGMVKLRVVTQNLLNPNVPELEEKLADRLAALVRVQEQMRKWKRRNERRI